MRLGDMKTSLSKLVVMLVCLLVSIVNSPAPVYSSNVVGYVNFIFNTGSNLFGVPLQEPTNTLSGSFSAVFTPPDGTTVSLWNPDTLTFDTSSTYSNGSWSVDLTLLSGMGAELFAPLPFTNTYVGFAMNHDGSNFLPPSGLTPPPVFTGPNGIYLFSDKSPTIDIGNAVFLNIIGRLPNPGEQVIQLSGTSTYLGDGTWDTIPTLNVGQAAFFNIIEATPEPMTLTIGSLGVVMLILTRRCKL